MAAEVVHKKQTGSAGATTLAITSATKGNILVAFVAQTASTTAPTGKDNIGGAAWSTNATKGQGSVTGTNVWVMTKTAEGGETTLEPTAGAGGTIQGISYFELSGATATVDVIVHTDNPGTVKTSTSPSVTTTTAGDMILGGVGGPGTASGGQSAWTGTGPALSNEDPGAKENQTASTRCFAGWAVSAGLVEGKTFTANWTTGVNYGLLVVTLKAAAGGLKTQTFTASLSFAGSLPRNVLRQLAGTLSFAGSLPRNIARQLAAGLTFAGSLPRNISRAIAAGLSFTGQLGRNVQQRLAAALSFAGSLTAAAAGQFVKHLTASLSFTGQLGRTVVRQHPAVLTFAGGMSRTTSRALAAALTFQGTVRRTITKPLAAALSFAGGLPRSILARLKAVLGLGGHLATGQSHEEQIGTVELQNAPASTTELADMALATATLADRALATVALSDAPLDPDSRGMGYVVGQRVRLTGTFRANGVLGDPSTVTVKVQDAAGTDTTYADAVRDSEGVWHKDITLTAPGGGIWYYRFEGTGAVIAAGETSFGVEQTQF